MFDTHAHVHDAVFDPDRDDMLLRARLAGIDRIVTIGTDLVDSERARAVALAHAVEYTIGIHPHEAANAPKDVFAQLERIASGANAGPVAIGEMGLDLYYAHSPLEAQMHVLREQLYFAQERDLPAVFHVRDAFDEFIALLRTYATPIRGIVHCFTGDAAQAATYVEEFGFKLGIGGVLTFKTAQNVRDAVAAVGLSHLVLETDCPYLAPVPHRGRRNEPAFMVHTAKRLAEILETTVETVERDTAANALALFGERGVVAEAGRLET